MSNKPITTLNRSVQHLRSHNSKYAPKYKQQQSQYPIKSSNLNSKQNILQAKDKNISIELKSSPSNELPIKYKNKQDLINKYLARYRELNDFISKINDKSDRLTYLKSAIIKNNYNEVKKLIVLGAKNYTSRDNVCVYLNKTIETPTYIAFYNNYLIVKDILNIIYSEDNHKIISEYPTTLASFNKINDYIETIDDFSHCRAYNEKYLNVVNIMTEFIKINKDFKFINDIVNAKNGIYKNNITKHILSNILKVKFGYYNESYLICKIMLNQQIYEIMQFYTLELQLNTNQIIDHLENLILDNTEMFNPNHITHKHTTLLMFFSEYKINVSEEDEDMENTEFNGGKNKLIKKNEFPDIIKFLLDKKANPNIINIYNESALSLAIQNNNNQIAELLVDYTDLNIIKTEKYYKGSKLTPLYYSINNNCLTLIAKINMIENNSNNVLELIKNHKPINKNNTKNTIESSSIIVKKKITVKYNHDSITTNRLNKRILFRKN